MFAIWLLLCLISYIFAVMFTQLFKNLYETGATGDTDYFGRMDKTFFTLFQIMTLDAWADIARDAMTVYPWAWLPIITYVIVTGFVVVNLVIAVICDAVAALHGDEKAKLLGQQIATVADDEDAGADATEQTKRKQTVEEVIAQNTAREQLSALEQHVDELAQMQEQALQSIVALTQQLANANQKMTMIPSTGTSEDLIRSPLLITTTAGASG